MRLAGGARDLEGRVEICVNNVYQTVCDDLWDEQEARVVCRQNGYTGSGLTISLIFKRNKDTIYVFRVKTYICIIHVPLGCLFCCLFDVFLLFILL